MKNIPDLIVIGGGLAGTEAAWQAAERGLKVHLYEMRPSVTTGAHQGEDLAELVCSNSLGSKLPDRASGVLKAELAKLDSFLLSVAETTALPAGTALAVDRVGFATIATERILAHPNISVMREEMKQIPLGLTIIASGPLTSRALSKAIASLTGDKHLFFYDAIAPIVSLDSVNMNIAYRGSRFGHGQQEEGDYINCPFSQQDYEVFVEALISAERIELRDFESEIEGGVTAGDRIYFESCLPVEVLAGRGNRSLAFGPMRPIGLTDPRTGCRPYAVLQLRQDNLTGDLYNLVGFQTNLTFSEQKRVFQMVPGLENATFHRYGQMHRNTFIASPRLLLPTLQYRQRSELFFSGQITGIEGYLGNIASGLLAGLNAARLFRAQPPLALPPATMLGALCHYITHAEIKAFQPMKANFGILPPISSAKHLGKRERAIAYAERSTSELAEFILSNNMRL